MYSSEEKNKLLFYDLFIKSLIENQDCGRLSFFVASWKTSLMVF